MNQKCVVNNTNRKTDILALLDSRDKNTLSVEVFNPQKFASAYIFVKT